MEDRSWLILATALTLGNSAWGLYSLRLGSPHSNRWSNALLVGAFLAQFVFLSQRGQSIGHCPVTNLFEVAAFLAWSLLLTYLLVGTAYRLSALGFFTAPLVSLLNFLALVLPIDVDTNMPKMGWALELHASVTTLAYGPLGLTAVAGLLYLIQERQLKEHRLGAWFYRLPAMGDLAVVLQRVLLLGFILLTIGLLAGIVVATQRPMDWVKFSWSGLVWVVYASLLLAPRLGSISMRKIAWCSVISYLFVLLTFWGVNSLSHQHRFEL